MGGVAADETPTASSLPTVAADGSPVEAVMWAWLHEKVKRSNSQKTRRAYQTTLWSFRAELQSHSLDLDGEPTVVGALAQAWATAPRQRDGRAVTAATHNQRLAILSSFYVFARKRGLLPLPVENPLEGIERRPVQAYAGARPLCQEQVRAGLVAIDRTTLIGLRDYALLTLALQTGRRLAELAALTVGDLDVASDGAMVVTWRHCKGGKVLQDALPQPIAAALGAWLTAAYGPDRAGMTHQAVWISLAHNGTRGHSLTPQAIALICERRLGTSKVHALRHTFAHTMEQLGAKVSDIQARLGHESLDTTTRYLAAVKSAENAYASQLAAWLGVSNQ